MKKIVYLHGLESETNCSKVKYLRKLGHTIFNPPMDYKSKDCFKHTLHLIEMFKPDLIMGSSMGGYFAYEIGKHFDVPVGLLNPALHSRNFEPNVDILGDEDPLVYLIVGKNDDIINYEKTLNYLDENANCFFRPNYFKGKHGHRTPVKVLKDGASKLKIPYL